jgi:hypothetical protein
MAMVRRLTGLGRCFLLGCFGWVAKIVFTAGCHELADPSSSKVAWKREGNTYLRLHPLYGGISNIDTMIMPMARHQLPLSFRLLGGVAVCCLRQWKYEDTS